MSKSRPKSQQLLLDIVKDEVTTRLEQSLHNRIYIITDKEEDPSQVKPPWAIDIQISSQPTFQLPPDTTITDIYNREDIQGRLLILGAPGSGKTTTLLELAQDLILQAKESSEQPIPVLLNLSSWNEDSQSFKNWIVTELNIKYGVSKNTSNQWLDEKILIPLLDSLDELEPARQKKCVEQINELLQLNSNSLNSSDSWLSSLVVCGRTEEYQHLATQLRLNGSIVLQPLSQNQIRRYLLKTQREELWKSFLHDSSLMDLAKTPLFLSILTISFQEVSELQILNSSQDRISSVWNAYINSMLKKKYKIQKPEDEKTKYWLAWLAIQLKQENKTEFIIENLPPSWLTTEKQKSIYKEIICINLAIFFGINGIIGGLFFCLILAVKEEFKSSHIARIIIQKFSLFLLLISSFSRTDIPPKLFMVFPPNIQIKNEIIESHQRRILVKEPKERNLFYQNKNGYFSKEETVFRQKKVRINFEVNDGLLYGVIGGFSHLLLFWLIQVFIKSSESTIVNSYFSLQILGIGISGFISGFLVAISPNFIQKIKTVENMNWSVNLSFQKGSYFVSNLIGILVLVSYITIPVLVSFTNEYTNYVENKTDTFWATFYFTILFATLFFGFTGFIICGLTTSEIEVKTRPNQGVYKSIANATFLGMTLAVLSGITNGAFYGLVYQLSFYKVLLLGTIIGFFHGLMGALLGGGIPCLQHLVLRYILWQNGSIPWNYARFLDYATHSLFLQKVGGRYRFIHKLLQDHFAQMEFERK